MNCSRFQIKVLSGPLFGFIITDANYDAYLADNQGNGYTYALLYGKVIGPTISEAEMMAYVEALCDSDTPTPDPGSIYQFYWGYANLDTTGDEPLTAQDYTDSFSESPVVGFASQYVGGTASVPDFENSTDKVCWISVTPSEAAFTKWSEVGNPSQQDQPIDATFTAGTNAFFKLGYVYFTRSQTTFTGAVVLSR